MKYNFVRGKRLLTETQFRHVFRGTQKKIFSSVLVIYHCHNNLDHPRLGVIVPKKNIGRASKRNFFKRIIREFFRLNQNKIKNLDLVIVVNKGAKDLGKNEIRQQLDEQIKKITS